MSLLELASQPPPPPPLYLAENGKHFLVSADITIPRAMALLQTPAQSVVECAKNIASQRGIDLFGTLPQGIYSVPDICLPNSGPEPVVIAGLAIAGFAIIAVCGVGAYQLTRPRSKSGSEIIIVQGDDLGKWLAKVNVELNKKWSLAGQLFRMVLAKKGKDPDVIVD